MPDYSELYKVNVEETVQKRIKLKMQWKSHDIYNKTITSYIFSSSETHWVHVYYVNYFLDIECHMTLRFLVHERSSTISTANYYIYIV